MQLLASGDVDPHAAAVHASTSASSKRSSTTAARSFPPDERELYEQWIETERIVVEVVAADAAGGTLLVRDVDADDEPFSVRDQRLSKPRARVLADAGGEVTQPVQFSEPSFPDRGAVRAVTPSGRGLGDEAEVLAASCAARPDTDAVFRVSEEIPREARSVVDEALDLALRVVRG